MREIKIVSVIIRNFRSFSEAEVSFTPGFGLRFLGGENQVQERLGANGAGKTTLWEAITWCLYGKSIRGARTSQILRWGEDQAVVMTVLEIAGQEVTILRYGPPERIEIQTAGDPQSATQGEVDSLVGLSRERFLHSVIFGQGMKLFPDLSIPERGELFDEVLDLDIWSKCSEAATERFSQVQDELKSLHNEQAHLQGQLASLMTDGQIDELNARWNSQMQIKYLACQNSLNEWEELRKSRSKEVQAKESAWQAEQDTKLVELDDRSKSVYEAKVRLGQFASVRHSSETMQRRQEAVAQAENEIRRLESAETTLNVQLSQQRREWSRLQKADTCATCGQKVNVDNLEHMKTDCANAIQTDEAQLVSLSSDLRQRREALGALKDDYAVMVREDAEDKAIASQRAKEYSRLTAELGDIERQIKILASETVNPYSQQLAVLAEELNPYEAVYAQLQQEVNPHLMLKQQRDEAKHGIDSKLGEVSECLLVLEETAAATSYWKQGFKRIRLFFVQKILEALEVEIQSAVSALGLVGWRVSLSTETETKSGTIKLGVQIKITSSEGQEGLWETWSGGESQRLRLAMAMGLASLIQRAAGVWFGFEVWDEPSNWLSELGIEDLLTALDYRADSNKKQVWLVDHRALAYNFREVWMARKGAKGTGVYKVTETLS